MQGFTKINDEEKLLIQAGGIGIAGLVGLITTGMNVFSLLLNGAQKLTSIIGQGHLNSTISKSIKGEVEFSKEGNIAKSKWDNTSANTNSIHPTIIF